MDGTSNSSDSSRWDLVPQQTSRLVRHAILSAEGRSPKLGLGYVWRADRWRRKKVKISWGHQKSAPMLIGRFTDNDGPLWIGDRVGEKYYPTSPFYDAGLSGRRDGRVDKARVTMMKRLDDLEFLDRPTLNPALWISAGPIRAATLYCDNKFPCHVALLVEFSMWPPSPPSC